MSADSARCVSSIRRESSVAWHVHTCERCGAMCELIDVCQCVEVACPFCFTVMPTSVAFAHDNGNDESCAMPLFVAAAHAMRIAGHTFAHPYQQFANIEPFMLRAAVCTLLDDDGAALPPRLRERIIQHHRSCGRYRLVLASKTMHRGFFEALACVAWVIERDVHVFFADPAVLEECRLPEYAAQLCRVQLNSKILCPSRDQQQTDAHHIVVSVASVFEELQGRCAIECLSLAVSAVSGSDGATPPRCAFYALRTWHHGGSFTSSEAQVSGSARTTTRDGTLLFGSRARANAHTVTAASSAPLGTPARERVRDLSRSRSGSRHAKEESSTLRKQFRAASRELADKAQSAIAVYDCSLACLIRIEYADDVDQGEIVSAAFVNGDFNYEEWRSLAVDVCREARASLVDGTNVNSRLPLSSMFPTPSYVTLAHMRLANDDRVMLVDSVIDWCRRCGTGTEPHLFSAIVSEPHNLYFAMVRHGAVAWCVGASHPIQASMHTRLQALIGLERPAATCDGARYAAHWDAVVAEQVATRSDMRSTELFGAFRVLVRLCSLHTVVQLMLRLITSQSIVLLSTDRSRLSPVAVALQELCGVLRMRDTLCPFLPSTVLRAYGLGLFEQPTPFLYGAVTHEAADVAGLSLDTLSRVAFVVDLDADKTYFSAGDYVEAPNDVFTKFVDRLHPFYRRVLMGTINECGSTRDAFDAERTLRSVSKTLIAELLESLRTRDVVCNNYFVVPANVWYEHLQSLFDGGSLPWYRLLVDTQAFACFVVDKFVVPRLFQILRSDTPSDVMRLLSHYTGIVSEARDGQHNTVLHALIQEMSCDSDTKRDALAFVFRSMWYRSESALEMRVLCNVSNVRAQTPLHLALSNESQVPSSVVTALLLCRIQQFASLREAVYSLHAGNVQADPSVARALVRRIVLVQSAVRGWRDRRGNSDAISIVMQRRISQSLRNTASHLRKFASETGAKVMSLSAALGGTNRAIESVLELIGAYRRLYTSMETLSGDSVRKIWSAFVDEVDSFRRVVSRVATPLLRMLASGALLLDIWHGALARGTDTAEDQSASDDRTALLRTILDVHNHLGTVSDMLVSLCDAQHSANMSHRRAVVGRNLENVDVRSTRHYSWLSLNSMSSMPSRAIETLLALQESTAHLYESDDSKLLDENLSVFTLAARLLFRNDEECSFQSQLYTAQRRLVHAGSVERLGCTAQCHLYLFNDCLLETQLDSNSNAFIVAALRSFLDRRSWTIVADGDDVFSVGESTQRTLPCGLQGSATYRCSRAQDYEKWRTALDKVIRECRALLMQSDAGRLVANGSKLTSPHEMVLQQTLSPTFGKEVCSLDLTLHTARDGLIYEWYADATNDVLFEVRYVGNDLELDVPGTLVVRECGTLKHEARVCGFVDAGSYGRGVYRLSWRQWPKASQTPASMLRLSEAAQDDDSDSMRLSGGGQVQRSGSVRNLVDRLRNSGGDGGGENSGAASTLRRKLRRTKQALFFCTIRRALRNHVGRQEAKRDRSGGASIRTLDEHLLLRILAETSAIVRVSVLVLVCREWHGLIRSGQVARTIAVNRVSPHNTCASDTLHGRASNSRVSTVYGSLPQDTRRRDRWASLLGIDQAKSEARGLFDRLILVTVGESIDKQIRKDLKRTFVAHNQRQDYLTSLEAVLRAYAAYDPQVGYVQGMAFFAACFLQHMTPESSFWAFVKVMCSRRYHLRASYLPSFPQLVEQLWCFQNLIGTNLPRLGAHFSGIGLRTPLFATEWFLTIFLAVLPLSLSERIFESFILSGWSYAYRCALTILYTLESELVSQSLDGCLVVLMGVGARYTDLYERGECKLVEATNSLFVNVTDASLLALHEEFKASGVDDIGMVGVRSGDEMRRGRSFKKRFKKK